MSTTRGFVVALQSLAAGERSRLRRLAGAGLDASQGGFDLFTGIWWPLREKSPATPRREPSWLVAKLFGSFPLPQVEGEEAQLAAMVGVAEPRGDGDWQRFRARFEMLLTLPLAKLEDTLRWAINSAARAAKARNRPGLDWVGLLDDLSIWDRGVEHRKRKDVREVWAEQYLNAVTKSKGRLPC
ncbi:MAG: type I-E CRISPR-associated protein Cse2/CasB [Planctomycetia bacterium]|nr:type I-E CRISPR-associated protein Cse2/CasB [Planctomycetia bacterium]